MSRKRKLPPLLHGPLYASIRAGIAALGSLPVEPTLQAARAAGRAFAGAPFNRSRLQRAVSNLEVAFPEWSPERRGETAIHAYEHLFGLAAETAFIQRFLNRDGWMRLLEVGDVSATMPALLSGRPCIMITGHCGNWELLGCSLALLGFPSHALYRPLDLKPLDAWVRRSRERLGLTLIDKFGAAEQLNHLIPLGVTPGFVADQNAGDKGLFVPFFGRLASAYKSIALLAQAHNAYVLCSLSHRIPPHQITRLDPDVGSLRYRLDATDIFGPDEYNRHPDPTFYITARYRRAIEQGVRLAPDQYLWMHRYWKSRPRHEKLGRPFPAALRAKLQSLPWMTPAELARIEAHSAADTEAWAKAHPRSAEEPAPEPAEA